VIENVAGQRPEFEGAIRADGDVVEEAGSMTQTMGAAVLQGLPDGVGAVGFAGVDGNGEVGALDGMEGCDMFFGRVAVFAPGEVKADDATVTPADGELGRFERVAAIAHGANDEPRGDAVIAGAFFKACDDGGNDFILSESIGGMIDGSEADLGMDDSVGRHVCDELGGDSLEAIFCLHDADGVGEAGEIF